MNQSVTSYDVRAELEDMLERDLLGPWDGPAEELPPGTSPGERYLLARLVPQRKTTDEPVTDAASAPEDDDVEDRPELVEEATLDFDRDDREAPPSAAAVRGRAMAASSLGLACTLPPEIDRVQVTASWGRYQRTKSDGHITPTGRSAIVWKRVAAGGDVEIPVHEDSDGQESPDGEQEGVVVRWRVRHRHGRRIVEVFLLNGQPVVADSPDRNRLFQAGLTVTAPDGAAAVFVGHNDPHLPEMRRDEDRELRLLALQHRAERLYATGRLCAVDADVRPGDTRAWRLRTTSFPAADVPMVVAGDPAETPGLVLEMTRLGSPDLEPDDLVRGLRPLVDGYRRWLDTQATTIDTDAEVDRFRDVAEPALQRARDVADRLDRAVDLLKQNAQAREAFRFANQAMAQQRVRSELVRRRGADPTAELGPLLRELDVPANRSWRPFQLAFILLCLPGLTDPTHTDAHRGPLLAGEAELVFFPTGGGKTEAYLGLTAYTIAIRRLQGVVGTGDEARDGTDGVAVLMRYTLRLLTAQQFQRATALICACELLRRERIAGGDLRWGSQPVRIGLWVGSSVTPNSFETRCASWRMQPADPVRVRSAGCSSSPAAPGAALRWIWAGTATRTRSSGAFCCTAEMPMVVAPSRGPDRPREFLHSSWTRRSTG